MFSLLCLKWLLINAWWFCGSSKKSCVKVSCLIYHRILTKFSKWGDSGNFEVILPFLKSKWGAMWAEKFRTFCWHCINFWLETFFNDHLKIVKISNNLVMFLQVMKRRKEVLIISKMMAAAWSRSKLFFLPFFPQSIQIGRPCDKLNFLFEPVTEKINVLHFLFLFFSFLFLQIYQFFSFFGSRFAAIVDSRKGRESELLQVATDNVREETPPPLH